MVQSIVGELMDMHQLVRLAGWKTCVNNLPVQSLCEKITFGKSMMALKLRAPGTLGATATRALQIRYQEIAVCAGKPKFTEHDCEMEVSMNRCTALVVTWC